MDQKVREPIALKMDGALGGVLNRALQVEPVAIALAVLVEERELEGNWTVQVTAAQLVPVPDKSPRNSPNGAPQGN